MTKRSHVLFSIIIYLASLQPTVLPAGKPQSVRECHVLANAGLCSADGSIGIKTRLPLELLDFDLSSAILIIEWLEHWHEAGH